MATLSEYLIILPSEVSSCGESEPEVIRCLKLTLINSVKGIVKQIISLMHSWEATENYGTYQHKQIVPESLLKTVPKEWNYTPREMKRKESGKCFTRLAAQAVSIVISKLPTVIACLPPPIKYFFFLAERKMSRNFAELKKAGLLVWNLIVIICRIFEDGNTAELLTGATLDRWSKEKLSLVRVCLESIMGKQKSGPKQVTQKVIQSIEQQRPNWIESQLLKARKLSTDCALVTVEGATLEEGDIALGFTEQKINMMVLDICHKPGGSEYLRQIYHIIRLNEVGKRPFYRAIRAGAVPLLDHGCTVNRAAVRITSASLLPKLERVNGPTAAERDGILALERCAEFFRSCLFERVCAGCRPGHLKWRI
ncbi:PREDICTED: uncharacterized protein KIAA0825-like [Fulmarus glacialis]|uniref:uncharacterized protein KIAA0825-like n=1 Tax=Fulmarus glacialis TaxID=30455 RepID=UPI00051C4866|nr:PREDICTED: uncharacterized protein KIAA0825-like [Fulmarus glacialis]